jgi:hypothetical protein
VCQAEHVGCFSKSLYQKESDVNATIVGVDLAKNIFELAVADSDWRITQRQRHPTLSLRPSLCLLARPDPNERSSAEKRRLGRISKQGDVCLRTLLVHGARSALLAAHRALRAGRPLDRLRQWALDCERQRGHNNATVALANRIARIVWATWKYERPFDGNWSPEAN